MPGRIGFDPTTTDHSEAQFRLGAEYEHEGQKYRYVQFKEIDVVAVAAGSPVGWVDTSCTKVATDISATLGSGALAGVALMANTDDYYGFILTDGYLTAATYTTGGNVVKTGGMIFAGDDTWNLAPTNTSYCVNVWAHADDATNTGTGLTVRGL